MTTLSIIEEIAGTSSKLTKEAIILREKDNHLLKKVFSAAYDPRIVYGIKQLPVVNRYNLPPLSLSVAIDQLIDIVAGRNVTGDRAFDFVAILLGSLSENDAVVLRRIIARDLRMGCSESTINKVHPKLINEYPYMRYNLFSKVKHETYTWKEGVYVQTKEDGLYTAVDHYDNGEVLGRTRQGAEQPAEYFSDIFSFFENCSEEGYQYHGEILVRQNGAYLPREEGNGIINSLTKGGSLEPGMSLHYVVWDMVPLAVIDGEEECEETYKQRFARMQRMQFTDTVQLVETDIVHSFDEAFVIYEKALKAGKEGVMWKSGDLMWKDHTTSKGAKLKLQVDIDLRITGFTAGKGKRAATFGAVQCESEDGLLKVDVSGFNDKMLEYINTHRQELIGTIMCVRGNQVMLGTPASIFLPRFVELRQDKKTADTLQQIIDQFENAKQGKRK